MKFVLLMIQNNYDEFYSYQCMYTMKYFNLMTFKVKKYFRIFVLKNIRIDSIQK